MRILLLLALLSLPPAAQAQVYRWVDGKGTVHYSNNPPPAGVKHTTVNIEAKAGTPSPDTKDCYTVRCQGERMEQRIAQRREAEARADAARAAIPPGPRGMDMRTFTMLKRGMSESEVVVTAGNPDLMFSDWDRRTYTYLPTATDPFTTVVTAHRGRVIDLERIRKF